MNEPLTTRTPATEPRPHEARAETPVVPSDSLFHGQREVWIEHEGERYRLRITRRGKLILQK